MYGVMWLYKLVLCVKNTLFIYYASDRLPIIGGLLAQK